MSVTCYFSGRWGNIIFATATMLAYCKKHNFDYVIPDKAVAYNHFRNGDVSVPISLKSTAPNFQQSRVYHEPYDKNKQPYYHEIPKMDNVKLVGYFQSFLYFDWCRDYILDTFNFRNEIEKGIVSIHIRRGDCLESPINFPLAPMEYYRNAIRYMQDKGFNSFRVYSDDIPYCMDEFKSEKYNGAEFQFSIGKTEEEDYVSMLNCEHNITARSTFSLTAAWMNRNSEKIVLVPTTKHRYWKCQNRDLIPEYFHQIDFNNPY